MSALKNHIDIAVREKSGVVSSSDKAANFLLSARQEDILNYARSGNDLLIEFKDGKRLAIAGFFAQGAGFHNLVLKDKGAFLVDFDKALSERGDGIDDARIHYEQVRDSGSVKTLLGVLAGVAVVGGAGAAVALSRKGDSAKDGHEKHLSPSGDGSRSGDSSFIINGVRSTAVVELELINGRQVRGDFVTADNRLIYTIKLNSGALKPGDTVWMRIVNANKEGDEGEWIQATSAGEGLWTVDHRSDAHKLADGAYEIKATVRDADGNKGVIVTRTVEVETTPGEIPDINFGRMFDGNEILVVDKRSKTKRFNDPQGIDLHDNIWDDTGGYGIVDFQLAGDTPVTADLGKIMEQKTGFNRITLGKGITGFAGANGDDVFTAGSGYSFFNGRGGDDTFYLHKDSKTTLFYEVIDSKDATGGNGHDTAHGFTVGSYETNKGADRIDIRGLLQGYKADADGAAHYVDDAPVIKEGNRIADYLSVKHENGDTILFMDRDGTGSDFEATAFLTLKDVQVELAELLANHQIIV